MTPTTPAMWRTELVHSDGTTLWRGGMSTDAVTRQALEVRSQDGDELFRIQTSLPLVLLSELSPPTYLSGRSPPPSEERERGILSLSVWEISFGLVRERSRITKTFGFP